MKNIKLVCSFSFSHNKLGNSSNAMNFIWKINHDKVKRGGEREKGGMEKKRKTLCKIYKALDIFDIKFHLRTCLFRPFSIWNCRHFVFVKIVEMRNLRFTSWTYSRCQSQLLRLLLCWNFLKITWFCGKFQVSGNIDPCPELVL